MHVTVSYLVVHCVIKLLWAPHPAGIRTVSPMYWYRGYGLIPVRS